MAQIAHTRARGWDGETWFTPAGIAASGSAIGAAAVAGLVAGVVMAAASMLYSTVTGMGMWLPVRTISAVWYGVGALVGGAGVLAAGVITHMVVSAAWGAIFGLFVGRKRTSGAAAGIGLLFGAAIWGIMTFLVLTWLNRDMYERVMLHPWWWFGYHLLYGLVLGALTPGLARAFSGVERDRPAAPAEAPPTASTARGAAPPDPDGARPAETGAMP